MRRNVVAAVGVATLLASIANPHFVEGGASDAYGSAPWWQWAGARLCLLALLVGSIVLWRRSGKHGFTILACEFLLYVSVVAGAVLFEGKGHFSNGWGGSFRPAFYVAVVLRVLLLYLAYREARATAAQPNAAADVGQD